MLWDHTNQTNDHHWKQNKEQDISSEGSTENSEISEQDVSNGEESQNGDLKSDSELDPSSQDRFNLDAEAHEYHDEHLRFLVHNTTADGIHFMLTAIKMWNTAWQNSRSQKFAVFFGDVPILTL